MSLSPLLNPIQQYMLRLLLFGAGKTILHRNRICEVVETHEKLRYLVPLDDSKPFWVPRRPADRKQFNVERMWRSRRYRTSFRAPSWKGEPRPKLKKVPLRSNYPSSAYLTYLVHELAYNGHAAFAAVTRGHLPWMKIIDRGTLGERDGAGTHPEHPYIPLAPQQRTTTGGGFRKEQVTAVIAKHRWDDKHASAVFEIVYMRRKPFLVAASLGLKTATVYQYCSRVRADLRRAGVQDPAGVEPDLSVENSNPFVFSECVQKGG